MSETTDRRGVHPTPPGPPSPPQHTHDDGTHCCWVRVSALDQWRRVGDDGIDLGPCPGWAPTDRRGVIAGVDIERACEVMHDAYESAAVAAGWATQTASRKPWADVPEANKMAMRAAVGALFAHLHRALGQGEGEREGTTVRDFPEVNARHGDTPCRRSSARNRWECITWPGKPTHYPCAHDHAHCDFIGCVEHIDGMHVDYRGDAIVHVGCHLCRPDTTEAGR